MNVLISIAAAETPSAINLVLTGFLFVVLVLALLAAMTWLGGRFFARQDALKPPLSKKTVKAPKVEPSPATADAEVEGQLAAVITAAIHLTLQEQKFRVRSIRRMAPGWAQEGRRQIFSSHRLR